ncbi:Putative aldolase [Olavius sp. associated proteobacterium Delta 1]|nr:Putative aldolase [Olavius sp. associated proteobacterium Delta 1]
MPDVDDLKEGKQYYTDKPQKGEGFFLKGSNNLEWGMKDRLARIFNPVSGNTVMLAFDHGYLMGPTSGLERMDLTIVPLIEYADCIMCTRGALRTIVPPTCGTPVSLRYSSGTTVLTELNDECLMDIEEAVRLNASLLAVMVAVGDRFEATTIRNLTRTVDLGTRYGIPTLGVTAVGKDMARDARYISMASRVCAENGAHVVKTYFCDDFEKVTSTCPVPIVLAGGKKLPELDALTMAYRAIDQGANGVDMGRNIFQAGNPIAMIQAVKAVVHDREIPEKAFDMYNTLKAEQK